MLIGEALREQGLDERAVAATFVHVLRKLTRKTDTTGSVEKLLVDVLKECSRHLGPSERAAATDSAVIVQLIHRVPRPERLNHSDGPPSPELRPAMPATDPPTPDPQAT
jgi:hypothetical protein